MKAKIQKTVKYEIKEQLGEGRFAKVYKVHHSLDQKTYACKILQESSFDSEPFQKEIGVLKIMNHKNIINLIDEDQDSGMILEFAENGELFKNIKKCGGFSHEIANFYFKQLIEGLEYIHE